MGTKNGHMVGIRPDDLTARVLQGLLKRNSKLPLEKIDDVILGCAFPESSQGMLLARSAAILAGIPKEAGGKVVNRFCGSSMDAVHQADYAINQGDAEVVIAAGVEDMISIPMGGFNPDFHPALAEKNFYIGMGETAEILAREGGRMGETAEILAREGGISREEQEAFAISSHQKALDAMKNGRFENEIIPLLHNGMVIKNDESPREPDMEKIKSLKPAFLKDGTITAATSSPITKGVAALLLTSNITAQEYGLKPRARIISRAIAGVDWERMGMGPLPATQKALKRARMALQDLDAMELNEAFAAQSLYVIKKGGWPMEKINLNGGAIALGHPLGCSGARILTTLLNVMEQQNARRGLATMCIGSGQGIATIIERM
jgi:acetyl-CoA acyltransferase